jgi:site-specific DNA-methyltransferase (adenine-specific)
MSIYYQDDTVTLYHGDCREIDAWESAHFLLTDPPYGISWTQPQFTSGGKVTGRKHSGIANDGDVAARDYVIGQWGSVKPAAIFGSPQLPAPHRTKQTLVWRKAPDSGLWGTVGGWRRDWEAIYLLGNWPNGPAQRSSVLSTNLGLHSYLNGHPHAKPVALLEALLLSGAPRGMVADPFSGSGTTLIASRNVGRKAVGVEIEERYCEIAAKRLDQMCLNFNFNDETA